MQPSTPYHDSQEGFASNVRPAFVYAVCGAREHIETLAVSLRFLRKFSDLQAIVVTDSSRNEIPIPHDHLLDVPTPVELSHRQASIYLKTGLHRWLPGGRTYCYLDSDVLACDRRVDRVFAQPRELIAFAKDHCLLDAFSPYAVNCDCLAVQAERQRELGGMLEQLESMQTHLARSLEAWKHAKRLGGDRRLRRRRLQLRQLMRRKFAAHENSLQSETAGPWCWGDAIVRLGFRQDPDTGEWFDRRGNCLIPTFAEFFRRRGLVFDVLDRAWHDLDGNLVVAPAGEPHRLGTYAYDPELQTWFAADGQPVFAMARCDHLRNAIADDYGVTISDPQWQHWNGGVFVFDDRSRPFLDFWHQTTLSAFDRSRWQVRDQGTLAAAAWKFGLQHAPTLPAEFNLIADYYKPGVTFRRETGFDLPGGQQVRPFLVHIYHEFGRTDWEVWQWLESLVEPAGDRIACPESPIREQEFGFIDSPSFLQRVTSWAAWPRRRVVQQKGVAS